MILQIYINIYYYIHWIQNPKITHRIFLELMMFVDGKVQQQFHNLTERPYFTEQSDLILLKTESYLLISDHSCTKEETTSKSSTKKQATWSLHTNYTNHPILRKRMEKWDGWKALLLLKKKCHFRWKSQFVIIFAAKMLVFV